MPTISTFLKKAKDVRSLDTGMFLLQSKITLPAAGVLNGDFVQLFEVPHGMRFFDCKLAVKATLGAGATILLNHNRSGTRTNITGATTAGAAGQVTGQFAAASDWQTGDVLELTVGGANVTAAAAVELDLIAQRL